MKRTQVYLPDRLHERIRRISFQQRKSMAQVVREAVAAYIQGSPVPEGSSWDQDGQSMDALLSLPQAEPTPEEIRSLEQNPLFQIIGVASGETSGDSPLMDNH
jgi:hypothetical protein